MLRVATYTGLSVPSNVIRDRSTDRYLVSNVAGKLTAVDGKGFVSVLDPAGTVVEREWISGGKNGVTLNAPKGLARVRDLLYVADIDTVRCFDAKTGAARGEVRIPGAVYLAGMAAAPDGRAFVADAAMKVREDGSLESAGDGAIWEIDDPHGAPRKLPTSGSLGGPAALEFRPDGRLLVATLGSGAIYRLDPSGKKSDSFAASHGKLDGIAEAGNKIYVSSWDAWAVYRRIEGGTLALQLTGLNGPGGLVFDETRSVLVVPLLGENRVDVFTVD
jgi:hypothetical protein